MSLPTTEPDIRALEAKCVSRAAADSARTVVQLSALPLATRKAYLFAFEDLDLSNLVRCALDADVSADARLEAKNQPILVRAAQRNHARSLKALLAGEANVGLKDADGRTALHEAAFEGHLEALTLLLSAGADAKVCDLHGHSPLMLAVVKKHAECVAALLPTSDLSSVNDDGWTALVAVAAVGSGSVPCFEALSKSKGVDLNARVESTGREGGRNADAGKAPLHFAVMDNHAAMVTALLAAGADADVRVVGQSKEGKSQQTPLHLACGAGLEAATSALLEGGADRLSRDASGFTPLHYCANAGHLGCALLLMGAPGPDAKMTPDQVEARTKDGFTPLTLAAYMGHTKLCAALIAAGALVDVRSDPDGTTLLEMVRLQHPDNAELHAILAATAPAEGGPKPSPRPPLAPPQPKAPAPKAAAPSPPSAPRPPPLPGSDAELRALDAKCGDPASPASQVAQAQMAPIPPVGKKLNVTRFADLDLGNLLRCLFAAGGPPDALSGPKNSPALVRAAGKGHLSALQALLAGGASHGLADADGLTALAAAAAGGHAECLQLLVEAGADARVRDKEGFTPLMQCIRRKWAEGARALLDGSDLEALTPKGLPLLLLSIALEAEECFFLLLPRVRDVDAALDSLTPLHISCEKGKAAAARALLERGASRAAVHRPSGQTPLHMAAKAGDVECVELLLGMEGDSPLPAEVVDAVDAEGQTALHHAARSVKAGAIEILELLLAAGADANLPGGQYRLTPLHVACELGRRVMVEELLDSGASRLARDARALTPLHFASYKCEPDCVALLLGPAGASMSKEEVNATDKNGQTPLHYAAHGDAVSGVKCLSLLLAAGADADVADTMGNTPLQDAIAKRRAHVVALLAPVSDLAKATQGMNALHMCAANGDAACLALLLPHLRDLDARTTPQPGVRGGGSTALQLACSKGQHAIAAALLDRGASRIVENSFALHAAVDSGYLACVILLVGLPGKLKMSVAEVNARDEQGFTALFFAAARGFERIAGVLIAAGAKLDAAVQGLTPLAAARQFHPHHQGLLLVLLAGRGPSHPSGTVCDKCGEPAFIFCPACGGAVYCGAECMSSDAGVHKAECEARQAHLAKKTRIMFIDQESP